MKVQRTLASSVPPRPIVTIQFGDAIGHMRRLCCDSADVHQLAEVEGNENALTAFWTFMSHKPLPSVYIRALAQSFLSRDEKVLGQQSLRTFVLADLEGLVLPGHPLMDQARSSVDVTSEGSTHVTRLLNEFLSRCSVPYLNYFRTACLNRCRVRRSLCHSCVEWDDLQTNA